jgi:hypothetical protein
MLAIAVLSSCIRSATRFLMVEDRWIEYARRGVRGAELDDWEAEEDKDEEEEEGEEAKEKEGSDPEAFTVERGDDRVDEAEKEELEAEEEEPPSFPDGASVLDCWDDAQFGCEFMSGLSACCSQRAACCVKELSISCCLLSSSSSSLSSFSSSSES